MKRLDEIPYRLERHRDLAYSLIRIYLGIALVIRGWLLLSDPSAITQMAGAETVYWWYAYIIGAHLVGGFLLTLGLLTRIAALLQIPVLVGAVFFIHLEQGLMTVGQSLELAMLVLFLLVVIFLFGPGPLAVDAYLAKTSAASSPAKRGAGMPA